MGGLAAVRVRVASAGVHPAPLIVEAVPVGVASAAIRAAAVRVEVPREALVARRDLLRVRAAGLHSGAPVPGARVHRQADHPRHLLTTIELRG